jgi:hypothetical protein
MKTTLAGLAAATMLVAIAGSRPAAALPIANLADQAQTATNDIVQVQYRRHGRHVRRVVRHYRPYRRSHVRVVVRRPAYGWGYRRAWGGGYPSWGGGYPYRRSYGYVGYRPFYGWGGYPYRYYGSPYRYGGFYGSGFGVRIGPFGFGFW